MAHVTFISGAVGSNQLLRNTALSSPSVAADKAAAPSTPVDSATLGNGNGNSAATASPLKMASAAAAAASTDPTSGAEEIPGMFKVLRKGDKVWFSIAPDQLNKPFFFSSNVSKGVGEKGLTGSSMGFSQLAEFRRAGNQVQLVAINTEYFAEEGTPQAKFVDEGFADSLIASAPVTQNGQSKEVLVEANALLFTDIPGFQTRLQRAYDTPFSLDVKNTSFTQVDNNEGQTSFGVQAHFQAPAVTPKTGSLPGTTPDGRSLLTEFRYSFLKLPDSPMAPRLADDRIGHFVTTRKDYTGDDSDGTVRYVNRWRLEKANPEAELSEPVKPVTYWIANDVPEKYRESVKEGILEWNKAFERIGFKDAIQVRQQSDADKFDTLDAQHASVRWYTAADVGSAVGPSQVDPRSGEILDADIRMADVFGRSAQKFFFDNVATGHESEAAHAHEHTHSHGDGHEHCSYLHHAGAEQMFAQNLLEARGDTENAQKLANAYVKDVVMHEVGHTLGLRHNFKGSTVYTPEQLQDADFTKENGLGSSVMDYHPFNLAAPGEQQGEYVMSTLGAYDYLAVEYAYKPLSAESEKSTLDEIALKTTTDPLYAYESDEAADASDPTVNRFDLGSDPLAFANKQAGLGRELWDKAQQMNLPAGTPYQELTRQFSSGLNKIGGAARFMARYVGGVMIRRDRAGTDNATHEPVPADKQREALKSLTDMLYQPASFKFKPEFVARLAKDRFDTWGDQNVHVGQSILRLQTSTLNSLLANDVAQRLIYAPEKLPEGSEAFGLGELYETLQNNIWSELPAKSEINQGRRDLQREYIKSVTSFLTPDTKAPGEAVSMMRYMAGQLKKQVDEALGGKLSLESRAHLDQCSQTLARALKAE